MNLAIRHLIQLGLALAFALSLAGCNSIEGAGRDIEKVGEEIQEEAEKHD
jgi:predicted small secreted protein